MELMKKMNKQEVREFFSKGWITHDAMWLYFSMQEFGAEKANKINRAAVKAMAGIEINRIIKWMGLKKEDISTFETLKEVIDTTFKLIRPDFMKLYYDFPEKNLFRGGFHECFANTGVKNAGLSDVYQCGIIIRIHGWLEALGIKYQMIPAFNGCLMEERGRCEIEFQFFLD